MLRWLLSFVRPQWEIEGRLYALRQLLKKHDEEAKKFARVDTMEISDRRLTAATERR